MEVEQYNPKKIREKSKEITYYISMYESLISYMSDCIEDCFSLTTIENGEIVIEKSGTQPEDIFNNSEDKVSKKHLGKTMRINLTLFKEWEILSQDEIEIFRLCTNIRNEITHNLLEYTFDEEISNFLTGIEGTENYKMIDYINLLYNLYINFSDKWYWEYENSISGAHNPGDVTDKVKSGRIILIEHMYNSLFNEKKAEESYNSIKSQVL